MHDVIEWLKTDDGEQWTRSSVYPAERHEFFTGRRGAFADIEPLSVLGDWYHAYTPFPETDLKAGLIDDHSGLPHLYEPEKLPQGLSCPA